MSGVDIEALLAEQSAAYVAANPNTNGNGKHADDAPVVFGDECRYPDSFYDVDSKLGERLRHLRAAAHGRQRAPTAVIGVSFARMSAGMPHTVKLDATVGSEQPLTIFTATVGASGGGKGDAAAISSRNLPGSRLTLLIEGVTDHLPPGSGQGIVDVLFDMVDVEVEGRKPKAVKTQVRNNAFFEMDEGEALGALSKDSILLETLRTIWSGKTVGQVNVDVERRRVLPAGTYTYGVNIQVQPSKAAKLIEDDAGGTPQRFLWVPTQDPTIESATGENPGPLDWSPPDVQRLALIAVMASASGDYVRHYLTQDSAIVEEIRAHDLAVQRGEIVLDPLDSHALNMRRRIAGLLALLDDKLHVGLDHWELSAVVMAASTATRSVVLGATQAEVGRKAEAQRAMASSVAVAQQRALTTDSTIECARVIGLKVHAEPERWSVRKMLGSGIPKRLRGYSDEGMAHAIEMGWVVVTEEEVGREKQAGTVTQRNLGPGKKPPKW